jgi:trans-aconitate 2-methyltransferase
MGSSPHDWDATAYHRLSRPQFGWGLALLDRAALRGDETVLDAGGGTGRLTIELLERLPRGRVIALDRSAAMLRVARETLRDVHGARLLLVRADLAAIPFESAADLIVSNATFHWVPDAPALYGGLFRALKPGGRLVAQCGGGPNLARLRGRAAALMRTGEFGDGFETWREPWLFLEPEQAALRLRAAGFVEIEAHLEAAPTPFPSAADYRAYLERVALAGHLAALPAPAARDRFLDALCDAAAHDDPPWTLDYVRLNLDARKEGHHG